MTEYDPNAAREQAAAERRATTRQIETRWVGVCPACYATIEITVPRAQDNAARVSVCPLCTGPIMLLPKKG